MIFRKPQRNSKAKRRSVASPNIELNAAAMSRSLTYSVCVICEVAVYNDPVRLDI